ncbi:MAG: hypothetical protein J6J42_09690 [Lachnospiraceae bacterium]|nr:hypothetical protein [Lachnospiraceae bacterium]
MSRYIKTTWLCFVLAVFCWITALLLDTAGLKVWLGIFAIAFMILFLCFLAVSISQKRNKNASPYRIFAIVDGIIGVCVLAYALYDFMTDTGWFAGMTGMLLLLFVMPVILLILLGDFLVWKFRETGKKK